MPAFLAQNSYGKSQVRLTRVTRHADHHDLQEISVSIQLEGDFAASYLQGDNSQVVATDTMKNTVYALGKKPEWTAMEGFGQILARHFLDQFAHVSRATITLVEQPWQRMTLDGRAHPHAFLGGGSEKRACTVTLTRNGQQIESGLEDLLLLKTTDSAFTGFLRDAWTTLPETTDRIFATALSATWRYGQTLVDWDQCHQRIRQAMLEVFARKKSLAVQQTLFEMGEAALMACEQIEEISLRMPNRHRILVNLQPFGLENQNEIFVATDEPFGLISGTLRRS